MKKFNSFFSGSYKDGRLRTMVLLLCLFTASFSLDGQITYTWTGGGGDNNWGTAANWSPNAPAGGVFSSNDILVFSTGSTLTITGVKTTPVNGLVVTGNTNLTLQSLEIDSKITILTSEDYISGKLQVEVGSSLTLGANLRLLSSDATIDGALTVNSSKTFNISRGNASIYGTVTVNDGGTYLNDVAGTTDVYGSLIFKTGSTYQHATGTATLPTATWESGSTCEIKTWTKGLALTESFGQTFSNFTWNCTAQSVDVSFGSYLTAVGGNLSIASTGTTGKKVTIASNTNISGNLSMSGTSKLTIPAGVAVTVNGDLTSNGNLTIESQLDLNGSSNGSLIVNGTGSGIITYNRQLLSGPNGNYHLISLPVKETTKDSDVTAVWTYNEVTGSWSSHTDFAGITSGQGFSMDKTSIDDIISFTGNIQTSDKSVTASSPYLNPVNGDDYTLRQTVTGREYGGGGWNLLGNPYTSAISIPKFIDANYGTDGFDGSFDPNYISVYIYDPDDVSQGTEGSYTSYTTGDVQAGQGFMVMAMNNGVSFSFTPGTSGMQEHATGTLMYKSARVDDTWPGLKLEVAYGSGENATDIVYNDEMALGLDPGCDVGQLSSKPAVEIYTALVKDNGVNFDRQALPIVDCDKSVVAIGVDSKDGGEVTFSAITVPLPGYQYYLEDRIAGTFTELGVDTYTVTLPANTFGTGRFYLHTKDGVPTGTDPDISDLLDMRIWAYGDAIMIQGAVSSKAICTVYNMQGNMIHNQRLTDETMNTVPMKSSAKGVYIVVVNDEGKIHRQKVVVF